MTKLLIGIVIGIALTEIKFDGIARILDRVVQTIQTQSKELAQ
jgi:hypothetical protein